MTGIGIIANPHAKLNRLSHNRTQLLGYIAGEQGILEITDDIKALGNAVERFRRAGVRYLAINGGDGTLSRTLTALLQSYQDERLPTVVVLGGGTINVLANNLGMRGSPEHILYRLVERYARGAPLENSTVSLPLLHVGDHYGFLMGTGTAVSFLKRFYQKKTGPLGSLLLAGKLGLSYFFSEDFYHSIIHSQRVTLTADGHTLQGFPQNLLGILVSTLQKLPHGLRLFPRAYPKTLQAQEPEHLEVVGVNLRPNEVLMKAWMPYLFHPSSETDPYKIRLRLKEFGLMCSPDRRLDSAPTQQTTPDFFSYTLDGEIFQAPLDEPLKIRLGPTIQFLKI